MKTEARNSLVSILAIFAVTVILPWEVDMKQSVSTASAASRLKNPRRKKSPRKKSRKPAVSSQAYPKLTKMVANYRQAIEEKKWSRAATILNGIYQFATNNRTANSALALDASMKKIELAGHKAAEVAKGEGPQLYTTRVTWIEKGIKNAKQVMANAKGDKRNAMNFARASLDATRKNIQKDVLSRPFKKVVAELVLLDDFQASLEGVNNPKEVQARRERSEMVYLGNVFDWLLSPEDKTGLHNQFDVPVRQELFGRFVEILKKRKRNEGKAQTATADAYLKEFVSYPLSENFNQRIGGLEKTIVALHPDNQKRQKQLFGHFSDGFLQRLKKNRYLDNEQLVSQFLKMTSLSFVQNSPELIAQLDKIYGHAPKIQGWGRIAEVRIEALKNVHGVASPRTIKARLEYADWQFAELPPVKNKLYEDPDRNQKKLFDIFAVKARQLAKYYDDIAMAIGDKRASSELLECRERAVDCYLLSKELGNAAERSRQAAALVKSLKLDEKRRLMLNYQSGYLFLLQNKVQDAIEQFSAVKKGQNEMMSIEASSMLVRCFVKLGAEPGFKSAYKEAASAIEKFEQSETFNKGKLSEAILADQVKRYSDLCAVQGLAAKSGVKLDAKAVELEVLGNCRNFIRKGLSRLPAAGGQKLTLDQINTGRHQVLFNERLTILKRLETLHKMKSGMVPVDIRNEKIYLEREEYIWRLYLQRRRQEHAIHNAIRRARHYKVHYYNSGYGFRGPVDFIYKYW